MSRLAGLLALGTALLTLITFAVLPHRALSVDKNISIALRISWRWWERALRRVFARAEALFRDLVARCWRSTLWVWTHRGTTLTIKSYALQSLAALLFGIIFPLALVTDARAILSGLGLVFQSTAEPHGAGALFELGASHIPAHRVALPLSEAHSGVTTSIWSPIRDTWYEPLGAMAYGLASVQAALGLIVLWGFGHRAVSADLRAIFGARPLASTCFLVLSAALAIMAAFRGFELSSSVMPPVIPIVSAGLVGLVMPWVMAYSLHYACEAMADFLGPAGAIAGGAVIFAGGTLLTVGSALTLLAVGILVLGPIVAYWLLLWCARGCLWAGVLFGELVDRSVRWFMAQLSRWYARLFHRNA